MASYSFHYESCFALLQSFQESIVDLTKKRSPIKLSKNLSCFISVHLFRMYSSRQLYIQDEHFNQVVLKVFTFQFVQTYSMSCQSQICTNGISLERLIADFQFMKVMEVGTWPTIRISNFLFICFHEFDPISSNICAHDPLKQRLSYKLSNET